MHHFQYRDGALFAEDVNVTDLAGKVGTPFYVYSAATLRRHVRVMREAFDGIPTLVAYAMKANSNQAVLKVIAGEGAVGAPLGNHADTGSRIPRGGLRRDCSGSARFCEVPARSRARQGPRARTGRGGRA